jgi:hypothetical protein
MCRTIGPDGVPGDGGGWARLVRPHPRGGGPSQPWDHPCEQAETCERPSNGEGQGRLHSGQCPTVGFWTGRGGMHNCPDLRAAAVPATAAAGAGSFSLPMLLTRGCSDRLSIVALVISTVSLGMSAPAALYTRRQAIATEETARIDKDRRWEELETAARQLRPARELTPPSNFHYQSPTPLARSKFTTRTGRCRHHHRDVPGRRRREARSDYHRLEAPQWSLGRRAIDGGERGAYEESSRRFRVATEWRYGTGAHRTETVLQVVFLRGARPRSGQLGGEMASFHPLLGLYG